MNKGLLVIFGICILLSFQNVLAEGQVHRLDFSDKAKLKAITMDERDIVRFYWGEKEHKFMVRDVKVENNKVDVTMFIEGAETPYYWTLDTKTLMHVDFERDDEKDMNIFVYEIYDNNSVILVFEKLNAFPGQEKLDNEITGATVGSETISKRSSSWVAWSLLIGLLVIIVLIIYLYRRRK